MTSAETVNSNQTINAENQSTSQNNESAISNDKTKNTSTPSEPRLLIVANRLPLSMSIKKAKDVNGKPTNKNEITFTTSSGGLVSALKGCDMAMRWIGWPGGEVNGEEDCATVIKKLDPLGSIPVFLNAKVCDLFYNGFCNNLLWPLFHYIPVPIESIHLIESQFKAYRSANIEFAKVVLREYREGDIVWIHDYHLMLLPLMLRQVKPNMKLGFFFHTPFPSSEIYRVLPCRSELLQGVLACNLIGFHTHDYGRHFQSACTRICGAQSSGECVKLNGQSSVIGTFPIGIDPQKFINSLKTDAVQAFIKDLKSKFAGRKVLLGIDRLDYIKGIAHKIYAYEKFLDDNPNWIGKCVLVQIAVPSRTDVPEYQKLKANTHELVGRVNGKFGSIHSLPIHYLDQSIPFDRMVALYRISDAMLITSVRDGMNLVAYEYIASQEKGSGVLILSEFAGAAQSLGAGAIQINPWNINEVSRAILTAFTMPEKERKERINYCFNHVVSHTAKQWARDFVSAFSNLEIQPQPVAVASPNPMAGTLFASSILEKHLGQPLLSYQTTSPDLLQIDQVLQQFSRSKHRLVITGLSGLLARAGGIPRMNREGSIIYESALSAQYGESSTEYGSSDAYVYPSHSRVPSKDLSGSGDLPSNDHEFDREILEEMLEENILLNELSLDDPILLSVRDDLIKLASDTNTTIVLVTSLPREWCDRLFMNSEVWCCAENGYYVKLGSLGAWQCVYDNVSFDWKTNVRKVFEYFTERTPKTYITEGETTLTWHYSNASDPVFAKRQANDLISHLTGGPLTNTYTEVVESHRMIQVRPLGQSKGRAIKHILQYMLVKQAKLTRPRKRINSFAPNSALESSSSEEQSDDEVDQSGVSEGVSQHTSPQMESKKNHPESSQSPAQLDNRRFSNVTFSALELKLATPIDYVLCIESVLERDEDMFTILNTWVDQKILPFNFQALKLNFAGVVTPRITMRRGSQSKLLSGIATTNVGTPQGFASSGRVNSFKDLTAQSIPSPLISQRRLSVDTHDSSATIARSETPKSLEQSVFSPLVRDNDQLLPLTLPQAMSSRSTTVFTVNQRQSDSQSSNQQSSLFAPSNQTLAQNIVNTAMPPISPTSSSTSAVAPSRTTTNPSASPIPPPQIVTCTIGQNPLSKAKYYLKDVSQLNYLMKKLAALLSE